MSPMSSHADFVFGLTRISKFGRSKPVQITCGFFSLRVSQMSFWTRSLAKGNRGNVQEQKMEKSIVASTCSRHRQNWNVRCRISNVFQFQEFWAKIWTPRTDTMSCVTIRKLNKKQWKVCSDYDVTFIHSNQSQFVLESPNQRRSVAAS